jgi:thymidylate kinase
MLIIFSGVDGAGKSTQIDILKNNFLKKGYLVQSLWSRGGYTPGIEFFKRMMRSVLGTKLIPSGISVKRDKAMANSLVSYIWLTAAIFDMLVFYVIIIRIKIFFGRVIICDRYIGDTFIDFSLNFEHSKFEKMWLWRLLTNFSLEPDVGFLFTLPVEKSMLRAKEKNEPFPDSKETLNQRFLIYQVSSFFKKECWYSVNGINSIEFNSNFIKSKLQDRGYDY